MKNLVCAFLVTLWFTLAPVTAVAQDISWEPANGPSGGQVLDIVLNSRAHVFACVEGVGVFRSIDNGEHWTRVNRGLTELSVSALTINSREHLFVGTKSGNVFRSLDNGENWTLARAGLPKTAISDLVINSTDYILVGTVGAGIYQSKDNGETWARTASVNEIVSLVAKSNGEMYAATNWYGVIRSMDNGQSWESVNNGIPRNGYPWHNGNWHWAYDVAIHPNGDVYASAGGGLYRSKDNGDSWVNLAKGWFLSIAFNSRGHIFLGTNGSGIHRSTDDGVNWVQVDHGFSSRVIHSLSINSNDEVFAGSDRIHRSLDYGNNWALIGGLAYDSYSLIANVNGAIFAGTNGYGIFRTTDEGDTWLQVNNGLTDLKVFALTVNAKGHVFAGTNTGNLYRSTDNGDSWTHIFTIRERGVIDPRASSLACNSSGYIFVGSASAGMWRSIDGGDSWVRIIPAASSYFSSIIINSSEHVLAGASGYYGGGSISYSTDGGDNWKRLYTTSSFGGIKTLMANANTVFAGYEGFAGGSGGAVRSTDNGENWVFVNTGLNGAIYGFANANGQIFAGTGTAVFQSKDNGDKWMPLLTGWPSGTGVRRLEINSGRRVFAATNRGVYRSQNRLNTAVHERKVTAANSFILEQNYPNPFNPETEIRFSVPEARRVVLRIYNMFGQEVRTLVDQQFKPGYYSATWDGRGSLGNFMPSGVYFYRLEAGGFVKTMKMVLAK